ncbi:LADA_0A04874g1_1 [Lachancea dasiensis]|uniref:LADA_0A04874g1_1 n=1 Tax=Lachancea dasiensis TaxID=1072105 RepID=A0A1G4INP7_9SACH|nr:LADA_0A04874g1_1 [Lachancea dasiensis]
MAETVVSFYSLRSLASLPVQFIVRVYRGGLNTRNIPSLVANFALNFFPVFIWLCIFKNAGAIPVDWRPTIHSKAAFLADCFMFGDFTHDLESQYGERARLPTQLSWFTSALFIVVVCTILPLSLWYYLYYRQRCENNVVDPHAKFFHPTVQFSPTNRRVLLPFLFFTFTTVGLNFTHLFAGQDESNFTKTKDIFAWVSYVLLHLLAPIFTAVYLYVFHPPGTLKAFSIAMGMQNIAGVFTHLLLPTAPPWFIHMYGVNDSKHVSYDQPGYAAGLTRVDSHLGTHLNSKGFHKSPIVFGAVPSLHSAMAVQCFLFLITRATSTKAKSETLANSVANDSDLVPIPDLQPKDSADNFIELESLSDLTSSSANSINGGPKPSAQFGTPVPPAALKSKWLFVFHHALLPRILGTFFPLLQWWSTMYLDHHFRFDLFVGMCYAVTSFLLVNFYYLQPKVLKRWCDLRMGAVADDRNEAKTMGMRVFKDTNVEWFFDPFA